MIRYALKCDKGHQSETWFRNAAAFDTLRDAGQLSCPACGSTDVTKDIMSPSVSAKESDKAPDLAKPATPLEGALQKLREVVEANADYVGPRFAAEARRRHEDGAEVESTRGIWGEATPTEAEALRDDGINIAPLPFLRRRDG